jgi:hypothetical protein
VLKLKLEISNRKSNFLNISINIGLIIIIFSGCKDIKSIELKAVLTIFWILLFIRVLVGANNGLIDKKLLEIESWEIYY